MKTCNPPVVVNAAPASRKPSAEGRGMPKQNLRMADIIHNSPQQVKQRKQINTLQPSPAPVQLQENKTGMPDNLKSGIEQLSGMDMGDVRVHYNSAMPLQLQALAYAQGSDIHVGPGQEKHLPHEAWHIVQQRQGRVKPTQQLNHTPINDDPGLEAEADRMGNKAQLLQTKEISTNLQRHSGNIHAPVQRLTGYEVEARIPMFGNYTDGSKYVNPTYGEKFTKSLNYFLFGGLQYGVPYGEDPMGHFTMSADHNEIQGAHKRILSLLTLSGFLNPDSVPPFMSNIEYITPARDETGPGGAFLMQEDIKAVKKHAAQTYGQAVSDGISPLEFTGDRALTGVPKSDFQKWIQQHNGNWELFGGALAELESTISANVYIQQTSGVLPEDFTPLFLATAENITQSKSIWAPVIAALLKTCVDVAQNTVGLVYSEFEDLPIEFKKHEKAVAGYLAYISQYMLSDMLSLTKLSGGGSTDKNLFAFMPRVNLAQSFTALPEELRAHSKVWLAIVDPLLEEAAKYDLDYWKQFVPQNENKTTEIFGEGKAYMQARPKTAEILRSLFSGQDPEEKFQRPLPKLDKPHESIEELTGQKGIIVEDRYFHLKYNDVPIGELDNAVMHSFMQSQERLLSHTPEKAKKIQQDSFAEPDPEEQMHQRNLELQTTLIKMPEAIGILIEKSLQQIQMEGEMNLLFESKIEEHVKLLKEKEEEILLIQHELSIVKQKITSTSDLISSEQDIENNKILLATLESDETSIDDRLSDAQSERDGFVFEIEAEKESIEMGLLSIKKEEKNADELRYLLKEAQSIVQQLEEILKLDEGKQLKFMYESKIHISTLLIEQRSQNYMSVVSDTLFDVAKKNILNDQQVSMARFKMDTMSKNGMLDSHEHTLALLEMLEAAQVHKVEHDKIKKFNPKSVSPEEAGALLLHILKEGKKYVELVEMAHLHYLKYKPTN